MSDALSTMIVVAQATAPAGTRAVAPPPVTSAAAPAAVTPAGPGAPATTAAGAASTKQAADTKRAEIEGSLNAKLATAETEIGNIKRRALGEVGAIARDTAAAIVKALTGVDVPAAEAGDAVNQSMQR